MRQGDFISYVTLALLNSNNDLKVCVLAELKKEIDEVNLKFMNAFVKRDYEVIAELYAVDCTLMLPTLPIIVGRDGKNSWVTSCMVLKFLFIICYRVSKLNDFPCISVFTKSFTF